jgi:DDE superfamily endonuclease
VLAACTMDMQFMFVLLGWEGSALDACVFEDAQRKGFTILEDCYYLADAGYANSDALLVPYKGVRYHLREWGIVGEWCVYAIPLSCNLSDLSYLGPGTLESCPIFGMHSFRTLLSEYLKL